MLTLFGGRFELTKSKVLQTDKNQAALDLEAQPAKIMVDCTRSATQKNREKDRAEKSDQRHHKFCRCYLHESCHGRIYTFHGLRKLVQGGNKAKESQKQTERHKDIR